MSDYVAIPFNDLGRVFSRFQDPLEDAILTASRSGWWLNGKQGSKFAEEFANFVGVKHCLNVANGTDALELALRALSILRGPIASEVITVANAGGYTSTACRQVGLVPVYVDVEASSHLLDIDAAVAELNAQTLVVVATHLYGGAVDIRALRAKMNAAGFSGVPILEDCAQAHGASVNGALTGSMGEVATFSFYPTKNLGAMGDGGAVVTSDDNIASTIKKLQQYGWSSKYAIGLPGGRNSRMDELQAAVLTVLLPHLPSLNAERLAIRKKYSEAMPSSVNMVDGGDGAVAHLVVIESDDRDGLRAHLSNNGIATDIHYPILDGAQAGWRNLPMRTAKGGIITSEKITKRIVSLPCFPGLTEKETDRVCAALSDWKS